LVLRRNINRLENFPNLLTEPVEVWVEVVVAVDRFFYRDYL